MGVARRGESSMAIANALGSNTQNVFMALGLPWCVKCLLAEGMSFEQDTDGIISGITAMGLTLVLFVLFVVLGRGRLGRKAGWTFMATYVVYVVYAALLAGGLIVIGSARPAGRHQLV